MVFLADMARHGVIVMADVRHLHMGCGESLTSTFARIAEMTATKYIEISCDTCGSVDYYRPGAFTVNAKEDGWIFAAGGMHFCTVECRARYRLQHGPNNGRPA